MGLLDFAQDPANAGLLQAAFSLLNSSGPSRTPIGTGQAIGQAGMQGLEGMRQAQLAQQQRQEQEQRAKMQAMEMQMKQEAIALSRQEQLEKALQLQQQQAALANASPEIRRAVEMGVPITDAWKRANPEAKWEHSYDKDGRPITGWATPQGFSQVGGAKTEQMPEFVKLQQAYASMPDGPMKRQLGQKLQTMSSHAPGVSVSYGAPVAGVDAQGKPIYFQPDKNGGAPSIIPGVAPPPSATSAGSEDERKAAGWVSQAENAWKNMREAAFAKDGALLPDAQPGLIESLPVPEMIANATRTSGRQKFNQASSSMAEALLRAATGAGVNKDEALQKIRELTPQPFDTKATIQQKMNAIPVYIESLRTRAGRALPGSMPPVAPVPGQSSSTDGWSAVKR